MQPLRARVARASFVAACALLAGCGASDDPVAPAPIVDASVDPDADVDGDAPGDGAQDVGPDASVDANDAPLGPPAIVSGRAFVFGSAPTGLEGATLGVVDEPALATTLNDDGTFSLEVPSGRARSFFVRKVGFHETHSALLDVPAAGLDHVGFQVPSDGMFGLLAAIVKLSADPSRCQIATTVSAAGTEPYGGSGLGEPDVHVTIDPPLPVESGPVYFRYVNASVILPDRTLGATTIDGGVLFLNAPPGVYTLSATKPGKTIPSVRVDCRAGVLVNAAPPRGLQVD